MNEGALSYSSCLAPRECGFSACVASVLLLDLLFIWQLRHKELGALCPDYKDLGFPSHLLISFLADECHIFPLVYPNILLHLDIYTRCKVGGGSSALEMEAHSAPLLHSQACTVSIYVPWRTGSDDSTWKTLLSFILVSFPSVMADEHMFPLLLAGIINHIHLCFPCNLLLLFFLKWMSLMVSCSSHWPKVYKMQAWVLNCWSKVIASRRSGDSDTELGEKLGNNLGQVN